MTNPVILAKQLKDSQQLSVRCAVSFDGLVDAWAEHLLQVWPWRPTRRNVIAVRLGPELRIKTERHFGHVHEVVQRAVAILLPSPILVQLDQTLEPDVADTRGHAPSLHRATVTVLVAAFHAW